MSQVLKNISAKKLLKLALKHQEGRISQTGALVVETGVYTGRSPNDRFIVKNHQSQKEINWGKVNQPIANYDFQRLHRKILSYLKKLEQIYQTDGWVCADPSDRISVRVISEFAYQALFARHILRNGRTEELLNRKPDLTILVAPNIKANPKANGTNSEAFVIINLEKKLVIIGGTKYAGEIKKSIFSYLNYVLPQKNVFPMHCSANIGKDGRSALFFGLSGTGKTTLSSDLNRNLIGDDEHGWSKKGIYNFEGGCYAKCINLSKEKEPQIFNAIRDGAVVENVVMDTKGELDFDDGSLAENTRVAYPLNYISNYQRSGAGGHPTNIIFLTADATGVLPAVARLDYNEAIYYFLSGYTSKLAGTERGIIKPIPTFSACFGAPFMPLKPEVYAELLKNKLIKHQPSVFLVNTGWFGGPYGIGQRISIQETRRIVSKILGNRLNNLVFEKEPIFGLSVPTKIEKIDEKLLKPRFGWSDPPAYDRQAKKLKKLFVENAKPFNQFGQK